MKRFGLVRLRSWVAAGWQMLTRGGGASRSAPGSEPIEFGEVLDQVWEEKDWVLLRAGALERSWQTEAEVLNELQ